ncbi:NADH-quinone oxidoreductase subunit NuoF [Blochmannia endosymbiont of Camponotus sp.]|uniref:NADH-quinone oxidoreductase subunit NuoF n=1 Tax=Blochmannia endosymbiont of Camponotus sp. TaxID=700220 RepID=UPI0020252611|nr:NADH-quinone oxidoreductase subunit NuoF [Blochmannia endosymbiont of Camponotus sp.]URJ31192.1 NADH-quinone oxidoreductase subunit NuoF [Blochmannia endosymbiont of Camponotus sp.]
MSNTYDLNVENNPLMWRMRCDKKPVWLHEYQAKNGYRAAHKAITRMSPKEIIELVSNSGLRGRGGGGFFTGIKWSMMWQNKLSCSRYLVCNADEMEPGTYKDRFLMERLPHLLLEGMLIASYALGVSRAYIFLRYEYMVVAEYLNRAISEIKSIGLIGKNIFHSEFNFELFLHTGAGRYICGEETALINALEGRRAVPRFKPPFPSHVGLWGKPTCINNVETLCNIPGIVEHGVTWYKNISAKKSNDSGTKLMGFSGRVKKPGVWELPFGTTAREILEDYAQGMCTGFTLKAWQPGGASTDFLTQDHLDVPMDFENIAASGSRFGTGMAIAIDNTVNMVALVRNLEEFFSRESCGWCTPCRDGLPWIVKLLISLENKNGRPGDIELLEKLCRTLGPGRTFCAHAPGAIEPLKSALRYFRNEFESGVYKFYQQETNYISCMQMH